MRAHVPGDNDKCLVIFHHTLAAFSCASVRTHTHCIYGCDNGQSSSPFGFANTCNFGHRVWFQRGWMPERTLRAFYSRLPRRTDTSGPSLGFADDTHTMMLWPKSAHTRPTVSYIMLPTTTRVSCPFESGMFQLFVVPSATSTSSVSRPLWRFDPAPLCGKFETPAPDEPNGLLDVRKQ
jgi:hypothetical protein